MNNRINLEKSMYGLELISKYRGAIMGFSALLILYFHEWCKLFGNCPIIADIETFWKKVGFCGVDIFLFLSGIGLTFSIKKSSIPLFYYRRLKRIILPFITASVLICIVDNWPIIEFWKNISGFNFYTKNIYGFLWFIPAIITLYLLFPLYYKLFLKSKYKAIFLVGSLEVWLILSIYLREFMRKDLYGFTNRIPIFMIGIYMGWLIQNKKVVFTKSTWLLITLTLVLGIYLSYLTTYENMYILVPVSNCCVPDILISISTSLLLAKFLDFTSRIRYIDRIGKGLTKVLAFYGSFSLESYCIQEWLGKRIINIMNKNQYPNILINILVLLVITIVSFSAYLIFKQFWKLFDKITNKILERRNTAYQTT